MCVCKNVVFNDRMCVEQMVTTTVGSRIKIFKKGVMPTSYNRTKTLEISRGKK